MQNEGNNPKETGSYVLDSFALLAYLQAEPGSNRVRELLKKAVQRDCRLYICVVNLGEIVYIVEREMGVAKAQETLARIEELPIEIVDADRPLALIAAHLKAASPVAYADCFAAALARLKNAFVVTGDPEFQKLSLHQGIEVEWLV